MGLSRSRTITLVVAVATLTSNILSSILFSQLPDDPYHLARNFSWYLHFANILSVFGFIGALRQHALSIALFANYLLLDTLLCSIPRFLLLTLLPTLSSDLCSPSALYPTSNKNNQNQNQISTLPPSSAPFGIPDPSILSPLGIGEDWSPESCSRLVGLAPLAPGAGLVAATLLQFVGALRVREYGRALWLREEEGVLGTGVEMERGLCGGEEERRVSAGYWEGEGKC